MVVLTSVRICGHLEVFSSGRSRGSGALLPEPWRASLVNQLWRPNQVVRSETEDEQRVHLFQSAQLQLP